MARREDEGPEGTIERDRLARIDRANADPEEARHSCALPVQGGKVLTAASKRRISKLVEQVHRGGLVVVLDVDNDWLKVQGPGGKKGWTNRASAALPLPAGICGEVGGGSGEAPNWAEDNGAGRG